MSMNKFRTDRKDDYVKSPLRYPGGKFYALKYILPYMEIVHDEYREPFVGGGTVFFGKHKVRYNWLNDLDEDIVDIYKVCCAEELRNKLINLCSNDVATRERHFEMKQYMPQNHLEKVFRTYYLNRTSYSGIDYDRKIINFCNVKHMASVEHERCVLLG